MYLLRCTEHKEGLQSVMRDFGIMFENGSFMARCSKCNTNDYKRLSEEELDSLVREGKLSAVVKDKFVKFYMCMGCQQVFWKGHQYASAKENIANLLKLQGQIVAPGDLDSDEEGKVTGEHDERCMEGEHDERCMEGEAVAPA